MKTGSQLARIDGVDTKRWREILSQVMLADKCAGFRPHFPRSAWCLQLHGRWHPHGGACQGQDRIPCYTCWYDYCKVVANRGLWQSKHRESSSGPNIIPTINFLSRMTVSSKISRCNSTLASNFALQFLIPKFATCVLLEFSCKFSNSDLQMLTGQMLHCTI